MPRCYLDGPLFKIKLRFVTSSTLKKHAKPPKTEVVCGLFDPNKNTIYVDKGLPDEERFHVLMHEWAHAVEYQTSGLGEEQRCDVLGMFYAKLLKKKTIKELLSP